MKPLQLTCVVGQMTVVAWAVYGLQRLCVVAAPPLIVCVTVGLASVAHDTGPKK